MADFKNKLRSVWIKGIETIGTTASGIATTAQYKVDEMNLNSRRREVLGKVTSIVLEMHQKGTVFPEDLEVLLAEVDKLDESISAMRAERLQNAAANTVKQPVEAAVEDPQYISLPEQEQEMIELEPDIFTDETINNEPGIVAEEALADTAEDTGDDLFILPKMETKPASPDDVAEDVVRSIADMFDDQKPEA